MKKPRRTQLLARVEFDLAPIMAQLAALSEKYRAGGEGRIAFEILQARRALDEAVTLARLYRSGTPLPTLAAVRAALASNPDYIP